jgi:hypothetical protein
MRLKQQCCKPLALGILCVFPHGVALIPALSILETVIETESGVGLLVGFYPRIVARSSAALLCSFALTMSIAQGILAPLGYGVFTAIAAALRYDPCKKKFCFLKPSSHRARTMARS